MSSTTPLLTADDVAHQLHMNPATVRALARDGQIRASFVGRRWLFTQDDVDAYLDEQSNRPSLTHRRRRRRRGISAA